MSLYDPSLTSVGVLQGGKLTPAARSKFFDEVISLLETGNEGGRGLKSPLASLFPLPPVDPTPALTGGRALFWFKADPAVAQLTQEARDRSKAETLHRVFLDILFESVAAALDVPGSTPFAPVADYSQAFGADFPFPPKFPDDFLPKLPSLGLDPATLTLPSLMKKLGIKFPPPVPPAVSVPVPPVPVIPSSDLPVPPLVLPAFCTGLVKLPFDVLKALVVPPDVSLVVPVAQLPSKVFSLVFDGILKLLQGLDLVPTGVPGVQITLPTTLAACLIVYAKNVVGMLVVDIISLLIGSGGVAKLAAKTCGLV